MSNALHGSGSDQVEVFFSGAYHRIRRITIALSVASTVVAALLLGWRSGLGLAIGSAVAVLNLIWLHHGSTILIERMISPAGSAPSRFLLMLTFAGRYAVVIATAYVILKGFPSIRIGFMVGLVLPILAAICEGVYEAIVSRGTSATAE